MTSNNKSCLIKNYLFLLLFLSAISKSVDAQSKPNIIWITCEDISSFLPSYGDSTISTPNLSKLASEGIRYTRMFSTYGVCAPTRSSIITGMYPNSIGSMNMRTVSVNRDNSFLPNYEAVPPPEVKCFTEYLRAAGYYCTNNAKTDYQFAPPITAWDENSKTASWRNRAAGQPFFAVFNIEITHESQIWVRQNQPLRVDPAKVKVPPYYPQNNPIIRKDIARMYDNIMLMDDRVGQLLDQLRDDHLIDSTIIFFYSDHGGPIAWYKREPYDRGTLVPFIIRFPDKKHAGTSDDELHSFVDLAPTMLSLAGLPVPVHLQGQPFLGTQKPMEPRQYIFTARDRMDGFYDLIRSARDKQYRYVRNYDPDLIKYGDINYRKSMPMMKEILRLKDKDSLNSTLQQWFSSKMPEELYDEQNDPFELNNLAYDANYSDVLQRMRHEEQNWVMKIRDKGFMQEKDLINLMWPGMVQPVTLKPVVEKINNQKNEVVLQIKCGTPGASIAYRLNTDPPETWHLYSHVITVPASGSIRSKAIRIGYKESEESVYMNR
ncbi:MAG: sulfatase-like hydrolase/transferase [Ginsengibacter sp.]